MCIQNMLNKASDLGCSASDINCMCNNSDFGYGIRDCTVQACSSADVSAVSAAGASLCAAAGKLTCLSRIFVAHFY